MITAETFCYTDEPPSIKRTQHKLVQLFSVVLLYVAWKRGLPRKFARFVLFRLINKRSFNLLCVLDLFFSERWQSTLFQIFNCGHLVTVVASLHKTNG